MKDDTHKSLEHSKTCTSIPEAFLSGSKQLRTPAEAILNTHGARTFPVAQMSHEKKHLLLSIILVR